VEKDNGGVWKGNGNGDRACVLKSKITTHQRRHKNVTSILLPPVERRRHRSRVAAKKVKQKANPKKIGLKK